MSNNKKYLIIASFLLLTGCFNFQMDKETFLEEFQKTELMPISDTFRISGRQIHFVKTPKRKDSVLIFVHGSPGSWNAFIDYFKNKRLTDAFDIIAVDRPGFGASDYGQPEPSLKKQVAYIKEAVGGLYKHQIWVGHSLGGPVVARMAMDFPMEVDGLVLLAPSIDPEMEKEEWYRSWFQTKFIGALMPTGFWVSNEEIITLKSELNLMLPYWSEITSKTVVIHGTDDRFVPLGNAFFAKRMMKDSLLSMTIINDARHFIPWTHQELIVDQLLNFK
ncbi:MAG: alpha/beta hydrolase [Cyclobacteriaceae bacterium]